MRLLRTVSRKGTNLFLKQDEDNPSGNDQNPYYNQHNPQRLKPPCSSMFVGVSLLLEVVSGLLALSLGWVGTLELRLRCVRSVGRDRCLRRNVLRLGGGLRLRGSRGFSRGVGGFCSRIRVRFSRGLGGGVARQLHRSAGQAHPSTADRRGWPRTHNNRGCRFHPCRR